jgi:hypothetical protein
MDESVQIVKIVVASPGDVRVERDAVPAVLDELNRGLAADRGLRLEAIRWEADAYPGFSPEGQQGLIEPTLRIEEIDLLIGIFWKRLGTPTRDAGSGTEHEFRVAYESWKKNGRPQIMVYLNQKPYAPQSREEVDQWGRLFEFRKAFPEEGVWWPYKGTAEFEKLLRAHLVNFIRSEFVVEQTQPKRVSQEKAKQEGRQLERAPGRAEEEAEQLPQETTEAAKVPPRKFDVFLSYNSEDRAAVSDIAGRLRADGVRVWWAMELTPGDELVKETVSAFADSEVVAVFVGPKGIGNRQNLEVGMALERKAEEGDRFRLIPVILRNTSHELVPPQLSRYRWVEFGPSFEAAYNQLKSAIQGLPVVTSGPGQVPAEKDLEMLPELLFRLVARLRERPEMLHSLEVTAFWAAVRKIQPGTSTIEDLRSVNAQLNSEPAPGELWAAWIRNTRATELAALLTTPGLTEAS